jgi:phage replication-related protein YjqB (UPF0714/DUF867 family)
MFLANFVLSSRATENVQQKAAATHYNARILKLRLPEQDSLKNEAERCSGDPVALAAIGRAVGQQIRITRTDDARFVAVYTISEPNPDTPGRADVVRTGQAGRERLGTGTELEATIAARVLDAPPLPNEPPGVRFFELAEDGADDTYFVAIAPHGGLIEPHTDEQATATAAHVRTSGFTASLWSCKGFGDAIRGASDRWHITSTDLHPASFPLLGSLMSRRFSYGVAFHGFAQQEGEADIYIGGGASWRLKRAVQRALNRLRLPLNVKISTDADKPKFQGFSADNVINRLATSGIHLEQSAKARVHHQAIARAVATVFASPWRRLVHLLTSFFR